MAQVSIVRNSITQRAARLDAEFFQPKYLAIANALNSTSTVSLSSVAEVSDGNHLKIAERFLPSPGVRYLRGQDISEDMLIDERHQIFVPDNVYASLRRSHIFQGDVLVTIVGANTGLVGLVHDAPDKLTASCKLGIARPFAIDPAYLYAFLTSKYGQYQILRAKRGGGQTGLILPDMRRLRVAQLPRVAPAIAKYVLEAHEAVQVSRSQYESAQTLLARETGLDRWQPPTGRFWISRRRVTMREHRLDAEHFHPKYVALRDLIYSYPHGWMRLTNIATSSNEALDPRDKPDDEFRYVELANINQVIGVIENTNLIKGEEAPSRARMVLRSGDVVASAVEGSLDKAALVSDDNHLAIGSTGFFVFRPRRGDSGYLLALVKSPIVMEQMRCEASGTILAAVANSALRNIIVPDVPPHVRKEVDSLILGSHELRRIAKNKLDRARHAVELAIEHSQDEALAFLATASATLPTQREVTASVGATS